MQNIRDKVAFITGAANGIGFGMAQAFAAEGVKVALADIDASALAQAVAQLRAEGAVALGVALDVRRPESWHAAVDRAEAELGPVQILCSNAGVTGGRFHLEDGPLAAFQWTLDVNVNGAFHAFQTCVPRMRARGDEAHIVVTASVGGFLTMPRNGAYSASKAAVISLCETLRAELAAAGNLKIGVSVLCPAMVRTNSTENSKRLAPAGVIMVSDPALDQMKREGYDPRLVGDLVVRGIREKRFWLFTHPEIRAMVGARSAEIVAAF
jgi:NAD(P)-dependent dehydrogenase (short-subunit alcohol dehydrogenase family)